MVGGSNKLAILGTRMFLYLSEGFPVVFRFYSLGEKFCDHTQVVRNSYILVKVRSIEGGVFCSACDADLQRTVNLLPGRNGPRLPAFPG